MSVRMTLVDRAPAPLIAMPTAPAIATEAEAAADIASIVAFSSAITRTLPPEAVTPSSALMIYASTSLAIWL